tara:strand:+ start:24 stop:134 length:111 start_codon:yes stop_codon:yes gene_type:complete
MDSFQRLADKQAASRIQKTEQEPAKKAPAKKAAAKK